MAEYELKVTVTDGDPHDDRAGVKHLNFSREYGPRMSMTNVERMTDDDLRATRDAINEHLGEG